MKSPGSSLDQPRTPRRTIADQMMIQSGIALGTFEIRAVDVEGYTAPTPSSRRRLGLLWSRVENVFDGKRP
jgi:hypothetical protein